MQESGCVLYEGTNSQKGAEIFQTAAADLGYFIDRLETAPQDNVKIELTQLGDFYDFWIGLKPAFIENLFLSSGAVDLVSFWHSQIKKSPKVGVVVSRLEELERKPGKLPVTILAGNHDNYMRRLGRTSSCDDTHGNTFWAEHGHQSDSFNCDDDASKGWALTQLAFVESMIRDLEAPVSELVTRAKRMVMIEGAMPQRLEHMACAADVCRKEKKLVYVMAHTHHPMLRRIKFEVCNNPSWVSEYAIKRALEQDRMAAVPPGARAAMAGQKQRCVTFGQRRSI